jgi:hypothetical protein
MRPPATVRFLTIAFCAVAACSGEPGAAHAGDYVLDANASATATEQAMAKVMQGQDAAFVEKARQTLAPMLEQLRQAEFEVTLHGDGRFATHFDMFGQHEHPSGQWRLDGERIELTFQDGRKAMAGTLQDGTLRLSRAAEGSTELHFVLKRKSG